jgi:predicted DNA-binding WGR domain protein
MSLAPRSSNDTIQLLVLDRIDEARNMARYYVLSIEPTLLGDTAMVREWGRMGCAGRRRTELHKNAVDARIALHAWLDRKIRRGYLLRHSQEARLDVE